MSALGMQLGAALMGDFDREIGEAEKRIEWASQAALKDEASAAQAKLQLDVAGARLKSAAKLAKTWRVRYYRNQGPNPAAVIFSRAPMIVEAFERGAEITSPRGVWLAIPNPELRFRPRRQRGSGRSILGQYEQRYGKLRLIIPRGRRNLGLLVTDLRRSGGARGGFRKPTEAARRRGAIEETIVFYLVPRARMPKLLRGDVIRQRLTRDFPSGYQRSFDRRLAEAERGQARLTDQSFEATA